MAAVIHGDEAGDRRGNSGGALGDHGSVPTAAAALPSLEQSCRQCHRCPLAEGRNQVVWARGNLHARLLLIGEAPGAEEDRLGLPFVGRSGQLLERLLAEGRVSLVPLGDANTHDARRVVRLLLLRLRAILAPLNLTRPRRTGVGLAALDPAEVVALDALEDRAVAAERVVREIGAVEADTELLDPTDAAGELLFVKVDRAWANARSPDVVLRWPRPLARDRAEGVRLVAGVAAGEVVAAFRVAGLAEGPDGALGFRAERPLTPRECLDLERRLSGRQHGWSIKYLPA